MTNLEASNRRITGVRAQSAGPIIWCETGELTPRLGEWVIVEGDNATFQAKVALPDSLLEADRLTGPLPRLVRLAAEADLVNAGIVSALEARAARRFAEVSAAHNMPYLLKDVRVWPDRVAVRFSARPEPTVADYVLLLKELAEVFPARIELFVVSEAVAGLIPPTGENLVNGVNGLLVELDPAILARATVGESLLDEAAVYRPGQRSSLPPPALPDPAAVYDPATTTLSVGGQQLNPPG